MGIEDITGKAETFLKDDEVTGVLRSERAEDIGDGPLTGVAGVEDETTGGKFAEQIGGARDMAGTAVGTEKREGGRVTPLPLEKWRAPHSSRSATTSSPGCSC